jgi:hypothetical protein
MRVDRIMICFTGNGLLESVFTKGYDAQFRDYKKFGAKRVARLVVHDPGSKAEIVATITALDSLPQPDDSLFEVKIPTPPAERIQILRVGEDALRSLNSGGCGLSSPRTAAKTFAKPFPRVVTISRSKSRCVKPC